MTDFYSGLRCRPGDLAVIIMDEPECQANIGQIVEKRVGHFYSH